MHIHIVLHDHPLSSIKYLNQLGEYFFFYCYIFVIFSSCEVHARMIYRWKETPITLLTPANTLLDSMINLSHVKGRLLQPNKPAWAPSLAPNGLCFGSLFPALSLRDTVDHWTSPLCSFPDRSVLTLNFAHPEVVLYSVLVQSHNPE